MAQAITRLFDNHTQALSAVDQLESAGIDRDRISLVSNNSDNWHAGHTHGDGGGLRGDADGDGRSDAAEGAGKGATTGGLIGGAGGLLAGLGMLAIPGLGPVVAAGWLVSTAVGAAVGAAAGGATGGLLGALKDAGHSDEDANVYAEGVRRGGTLVSVKADGDDAARVQQILDGERGVDAQTRGSVYRESGWSRFDQDAQPYTAQQIADERSRYGETRTFQQNEGTDRTIDTPRDRPVGGAISAPIPGTDL
jgi:hypothetical protein